MSLRARLLAGLAFVAATLLAAALIVTSTTRAHLLDQIDARLLVATSGDRPAAPQQGGRTPDTRERLSDLYEGVLNADGTITTVFEPNLPGQDYGAPVVDPASVADRTAPRFFTADATAAGVRYRVAARPVGNGAAQLTALPLEDFDSTMAQLYLVEGISVGLVALGLAAVAWWVIRLGIRPIKAMTSAAGEIAAGDVTVRVPEAPARTESGELSLALNAMLARIETATAARTRSDERLRQFVADASHELRTPITTIRGYAELYRSGGLAEPADLDDAMRRTQEEAQRMGRLVEDMLVLAKLDQERPLHDVPLDLAELAADAAADARAVAPERVIELDAGSPLEVVGDPDRLRQVVANVVGNALVHTPPTAGIRIAVSRADDEARIEVSDSGPGMTPDVVARVTERFFRADPSRARARGGSGLGMAIVDAVVAAHGGRIEIDSEPGRGTTVRIALPVTRG